jgi:hypothetical protein
MRTKLSKSKSCRNCLKIFMPNKKQIRYCKDCRMLKHKTSSYQTEFEKSLVLKQIALQKDLKRCENL